MSTMGCNTNDPTTNPVVVCHRAFGECSVAECECGSLTLRCCAGSKCDSTSNCNNGVCQECGKFVNEPCCGGKFLFPNLVCAGGRCGRCLGCGDNGQHCCAGNTCPAADNLTCGDFGADGRLCIVCG